MTTARLGRMAALGIMSIHTPVVAIGVVVSWTCPAYASTESRALTREAYSLAYELRFADSLAVLADARQADRSDPAPVRATAAVTWMEILFAQGVATFGAFDGEAAHDAVWRPAVPPHLTERFLTHVHNAVHLAQRQMAVRPHDADVQYQLGASSGLLALYRGTVEGRTLAAFKEGRRAVAIMEAIRGRNAGHREAALIPGIYRYAVSTLSWPKRMLAAASGMGGDRDGGILLLETAASEGTDTATDAALVLMVVYNREGRHADAMRHLKRLQVRHPRNRLLRLNASATALAASQPAVAANEITEGFAMCLTFDAPKVLGERALWLYTRGAARAALDDPGAVDDLHQSILAGPRDWVRARTHVELGKLALRSGNTEQARAELAAALHYGQRGGDTTSVDAAKRLRSRRRAF